MINSTDPSPVEIQDYILRLEKSADRWRSNRWMVLVWALIMLAGALVTYKMNQRVLNALTSFSQNAGLSKNALASSSSDPKIAELFVQSVESHVQLQISNLRLEIYLYFGVLVSLLIGAFALRYCYDHWNSHKDSAALAKTLRSLQTKRLD